MGQWDPRQPAVLVEHSEENEGERCGHQEQEAEGRCLERREEEEGRRSKVERRGRESC